eukprot:4686425-Prymnesium_polylepis.1
MTVGVAPAANRAVAPPMRSECVPKSSGFSPTASIRRLITTRIYSHVSGLFELGSRNNGVDAAPPSGVGSA